MTSDANQKNNCIITFVITCFKEGNLLTECLNSIFNQSDGNWKAILLLDGGSDPRTKDIFNRITDSRLRKIEFCNNIGPYPARNKGIAMADTEYVMPVDADDVLPVDCIKNMRDGFNINSDYVYGAIQYIGRKQHIVRYPTPLEKRKLYINIFPFHFAFTKKMWEELGGYTDKLAMGNADLDFYIAILKGKYHGFYCDDITYFYRIHSSTQISMQVSNYYLKRKIIVKHHPDFFRNWLFKLRFIGYGSFLDAENHAEKRNKNKARLSALKAIFYFCLDRPIVFYILIMGKINIETKLYRILKKIYGKTFKKIIHKL